MTEYKSILCLNGDLPEADFFNQDLPIIAADGAANILMKMGITPEVVIGDFDSIEPQYAEVLNKHYHYDQDQSDFEKSIIYLQNKNLLPAIIIGISGGYLDHILNNINHYMQTDCMLYAPPLYGYTLRQSQKKSFKLPHNTNISLLGIPEAEVSTQGLKWELSHMRLSFPGKNSCFNRSVDPEIHIEAHNGSVLILIGQIKI